MPTPSDIDAAFLDAQTASATLQTDVTTIVSKYVELRNGGANVSPSELQSWFDNATGLAKVLKDMAAAIETGLNG